MAHPTPITPTPEPKKRKRVAMWTLIVWTVLMAAWAVSGSISANPQNDAEAVGTGIGVALVISLWGFGVFLIAAITVIVRLGRH